MCKLWNSFIVGIQSVPGLLSQQQQTNSLALMVLALSHPQIHGDERDGIIAKLNQLQAYWGTGKGFYNQQGASVNLPSENPFCRFKVSLPVLTVHELERD